MARLTPGMHQGNGAGINTGTAMRAQRCLQLCIKTKRFYLLPIGIQSPSGFNNRHSKRLRSWNLQGEQIRAMLITNQQQIRQTLVRDQQNRLPGPLKQGIGRDCCA